jgi:hypothetical protein
MKSTTEAVTSVTRQRRPGNAVFARATSTYKKRGYALEILTGFGQKSGERFFLSQPVGMRTAVVWVGFSRAMETRL